MVARLKLKEIDGRAPPGVNRFRSVSAPESGLYLQEGGALSTASRYPGELPCSYPGVRGDIPKVRETPKTDSDQTDLEIGTAAGRNCHGYGNTAIRLGNSQPSPPRGGKGSETR